MFYYKLNVNGSRGPSNGYGTTFQCAEDIGDDHDAIVEKAIELGSIQADEVDRVMQAEEITAEEYQELQ